MGNTQIINAEGMTKTRKLLDHRLLKLLLKRDREARTRRYCLLSQVNTVDVTYRTLTTPIKYVTLRIT